MILFADLIRVAFFAVFGIGFAFMVVTNILAFSVLRPPKRLGFLWWHVTAISAAFTLVSIVALDRVLTRLGEHPSWQFYATGAGLLLYAIAQTIIFSVERQRYIIKRAGLLDPPKT